MIFVTSAAGKVTYLGPEWMALTGQTFADAVNLGWMVVVHEEDREYVRDIVLEAVRLRSEFNVRYRLLLKAGGHAWVAVGAVPSFGPPDRTFLGFLGSLTQMSDAAVSGLKAYGSLGPSQPAGKLPSDKPLSLLELAADHLIMAHFLLSHDGGRSALPALETALHHVGVGLAKASQTDEDPNSLH